MANKVFNMAGGLHSAAAYSAFEDAMYGSCVASSTDYVCSAGSGMNVTLSSGDGLIDTGLGYARRIQSDANQTISITAASASNPRIDVIVGYIDNSVAPTTSVQDNTNGILKFKSVAGTPAATPVAPSAATIQSSVGAGNPYIVFYSVRVPANASALTNATFTRVAKVANLATSSDIADGAITTSKIATNAVDHTKINWDSMASGAPVALGLSATGGTFTATHFGYCVIECAVMNNAKVTVAVNGAETLTAQGGATAFEWIPVVVPVCKGDVLVVASSDSGNNAQVIPTASKFIPFS